MKKAPLTQKTGLALGPIKSSPFTYKGPLGDVSMAAHCALGNDDMLKSFSGDPMLIRNRVFADRSWSNDPSTTHRSESPWPALDAYAAPAWFCIDFMLKTRKLPTNAQWMILGQIHAKDALAGFSPPLAFELQPDFSVKVVGRFKAGSPPANAGNPIYATLLAPFVLVPFEWNRLVVKVRFTETAASGNSLLQVNLKQGSAASVQVVNDTVDRGYGTAAGGTDYAKGMLYVGDGGNTLNGESAGIQVDWCNGVWTSVDQTARINTPLSLGPWA